MSTRPFRMGEVVMIEGMATEQFEIVGINEPEKTLLLHGDWSQYGYPPASGWHPMDKTYHTKRVVDR